VEEDAADFTRMEQYNIELASTKAGSEVSEESFSVKSSAPSVPQKETTQWAVNTIIKYEEFEKLRPKMALEYPFELDNFQKQGMSYYIVSLFIVIVTIVAAVMRLERRENVFVAAHTSAGKTVVAEYGIAL